MILTVAGARDLQSCSLRLNLGFEVILSKPHVFALIPTAPRHFACPRRNTVFILKWPYPERPTTWWVLMHRDLGQLRNGFERPHFACNEENISWHLLWQLAYKTTSRCLQSQDSRVPQGLKMSARQLSCGRNCRSTACCRRQSMCDGCQWPAGLYAAT